MNARKGFRRAAKRLALRAYRHGRGLKRTFIGIPEKELDKIAKKIFVDASSFHERLCEENNVDYGDARYGKIINEIEAQEKEFIRKERRRYSALLAAKNVLDAYGIKKNRKDLIGFLSKSLERLRYRNDSGLSTTSPKALMEDLRFAYPIMDIAKLVGRRKARRLFMQFGLNAYFLDNALKAKIRNLVRLIFGNL